MNSASIFPLRASRAVNQPTASQPVSAPRDTPQARSSLVLFLIALTSSALLYLSYFPVSWGFLGWVALVPFLLLVRSRMGGFFRYFTAFVVGLAFYWPVLQWIRVADPLMYFAWGLGATYCALYFPLALLLIRFLDTRTRLPLVVSVPIVWTALEFFRANGVAGFGFGWYFLGHTQHDYLPVIQIADITGAYGVSFLVAAVNALLVEVLYAQGWFRRLVAGTDAVPRWGRVGVALQALGVCSLLLATLGYGYWQLRDDTFRPGPRVALIQGNLDQRIRNDRGSGDEVANHFEALSQLASTEQYHTDMIVWPETSYPWAWRVENDGSLSEDSRKDADAYAEAWKTYLLLGLNLLEKQPDGQEWRSNSAVLLTPTGQPSGRYDKIHCVPFGEYVPLRGWVPGIETLAPYDYDYSVHPGERYTRFSMKELHGEHRPFTFGVVICYEDTDPAMARPYGGGDGQPAADFLVNTSNDGWFLGTSEHDEHLAVCRFRAVECRRGVVRAVNMGISAVIDGSGRVLQPELLYIARPLPPTVMPEEERPRVWEVAPREGKVAALPVSHWHEYKKVQGVLLATVPLDTRTSFYARWGDWLPWLCWFVLILVIAFLSARIAMGIVRFVAKPFRKTVT